MKLSKPLGIITGFAVALSCISPFCCSYSDISVHADFGDLSSSADYILSSSGSEVDSFTSSPVAGWILLLNAFQQFYQETDRDLASEGVQFSELSGYYIDGYGQKRFCTLIIFDGFSNPSVETARDLPVVLGADFTVSLNVPAGASARCDFNSSSSPVRFNLYCSSSCVLSCNSSQYLSGSVSPDSNGFQARPPFANADAYLDNTILSTRFKKWGVNANTSIIFRSSDYISYSLPPSQTMSFADLTPYLNGDFRSYVETNYPDDVDLLPEGSPDLPTSPTIDFTIPTADLSPLDPSEVIDDYSSPVSFWWTLTSDILDVSGLKWLALFGLSCAIFAYIIWRLGR